MYRYEDIKKQGRDRLVKKCCERERKRVGKEKKRKIGRGRERKK